jgi:3D (Asp-Asp-Asp) domain-containing protein
MEIWTTGRDWETMIKRIIIAIEIIIIILLSITFQGKEVEAVEGKYYIMTCTAYSRHLIADKHNDGLTASNTPIREGVAAINVDYIDGRWLIRSPLNMGDKIYIEGLGNYSVEDTGYFTDENYKQDFWNVDIYMKDYQSALRFGRQLKKIYILEG